MATLKQRLLIRLVNLWPPYLFSGIRVVRRRSDEWTYVVQLKLHFFNRNLFGTHFGGSLYAMADPFFLFLVVRHLGSGYTVWDKAAAIDFLKPGRGTVTGTYRVTPEAIASIREKADRGEKVEPVFTADLVAENGEVVARVTKRLWVRKKDARAAVPI